MESFGNGFQKERASAEVVDHTKWLGFDRLISKRAAWIGIILAGTATAGCEQSTTIESVEIPPAATFEMGVNELKKIALFSGTESLAEFIVQKDGTTKWLTVQQGEDHTVKQDSKNEMNALTPHLESGELTSVCLIHTRPAKNYEEVGIISPEALDKTQKGEQLLYMPPSLGDTSPVHTFFRESDNTQKFAPYDFNSQNYFYGVVDAAGVWYFRGSTDEDIQQDGEIGKVLHEREELSKRWGEQVESALSLLSPKEMHAMIAEESPYLKNTPFMRALSDAEPDPGMLHAARSHLRHSLTNDVPLVVEKLVTEEWRNLHEEYFRKVVEAPKQEEQILKEQIINFSSFDELTAKPNETDWQNLYNAYLKYGAVVRFVSFEDLGSEPPCAGPDYTAK